MYIRQTDYEPEKADFKVLYLIIPCYVISIISTNKVISDTKTL